VLSLRAADDPAAREAAAKDAEARDRAAQIEAATKAAVAEALQAKAREQAKAAQGAKAQTRPADTQPAPASTTHSSTRPAPPQPSPEIRAQIEAAIRDLSSDTWKQRQAAQDKLVSFGEDAIAVLRPLIEKTRDEEVRTSAGAALRRIEENAQVGASLITLNVKDAKPQDVFAEIAKQARAEFALQPRNMWTMRNFPLLTMNVERVNFWAALKEACSKAGVSPMPWGNQRGMTLQPHGMQMQWNGPASFSGPFMVVANRIQKSSSIELANAANVQRDFSVQLTVFAEPKVRVLQSSYNVKIDEAVDDKGNNLVTSDRVHDGMSSGNQWMWTLTARLNWPENPGTKLTRLKGNVRFIVQTRSETLDVPGVAAAKGAVKTVAGRRVLIKEVKQNGSSVELHVTVYRDGMGQAEWNAMDYPYYAVRMLDKDGRALTSNGWGGGRGQNEANYQWTFSRDAWGGGDNEKIGEPYRLLWEVPLETREVRAAFDFKDIPLPN
jgi:hypothetical protein